MYKLPGRWLNGVGWGESHGCGDKLGSLVGTLRLLRQLQASLQERHGEVWLQKNSVFLESCFRLVPKEETGCSENHGTSKLEGLDTL